MGRRARRGFLGARWTSSRSGIVELVCDWVEPYAPPISHSSGSGEFNRLQRANSLQFAELSGFFKEVDHYVFLVLPSHYPQVDWTDDELYIAGSFNRWKEALHSPFWQLRRESLGGGEYLVKRLPCQSLSGQDPVDFKFATKTGQWLEVPAEAANAVTDPEGNRNLRVDPNRTGQHIFEFQFDHELPSSEVLTLHWRDADFRDSIRVAQGRRFADFKADSPLGARVLRNGTSFRLFAPSATSVSVEFHRRIDGRDRERVSLRRCSQGIWETKVQDNLADRYYRYKVETAEDHADGGSKPSFDILDPYALAAVAPQGPGIIVDREEHRWTGARFKPLPIQDLVILEGHIRDLLARAPANLTARERLGFTGIRKWVEAKVNYLNELGINAIELQPIHEFDAEREQEYHWGYMPVNFFSPCSRYAMAPHRASQIGEFQKLVEVFHEKGIAVILDVVYNHVGSPRHLESIDRQYYFLRDPSGQYLDWSGCGNTLDCQRPMLRRLILDSLLNWVEMYDVDGFRFDLAELLGIDQLSEIESRLRAVKPEIILIAEPWSLRGHIGRALRTTGFSSWNDGYREFLRDYLMGVGEGGAMRYYLSGSTDYLTQFPTQSVNYVESHDDFCWIDRITENENRDGRSPTERDCRRTRILVAVLMSSLGVPMLSAGQDLLRSKGGFSNTYQRRDLNEIDYNRAAIYSSTHRYFCHWIKFRLSEDGRAFRLAGPLPDGYLEFSFAPGSSALAVFYNHDRSRPSRRLLLALNPHEDAVKIPLEEIEVRGFLQIADTERLDISGIEGSEVSLVEGTVNLPALSCGLWIECE